MIALNTFTFWFVCGVAIFSLAPVQSLAFRKATLAVVNATFLVLLLQWQAVGLAGAIVVTYLIVQLVARPRFRVVLAAVLGLALAALFVVHKLPPVATRLGLGGMGRVLAIIGYSYVAFRIIELLRAVFERRHPAPGFVSSINYLLPFHMLAAGPIQSYDEFVQHENDSFEPTALDVLVGCERIAKGLFKKFVVAYLIQTLFLTNFQTGGVYFLLEMQMAFIWLFVDFSAYSDIAVGVGRLMGVATPENFNNPLLARNPIDFWERWHISLSLFIRRNIFIPVQMFLLRRNGGRNPLLSAVAAIAIAFILCGLWHGLGVGYLIWGIAQVIAVSIARLYGHLLQQRIGKAGVKQYLANPWVRVAAIALSFEVQALANVALLKG